MDTVAAFIGDCCVIDQNAKARSSDLFRAYVDYTGDKLTTNMAFTRLLIERGYGPPKRSRSAKIWQGIGLLAGNETE